MCDVKRIYIQKEQLDMTSAAMTPTSSHHKGSWLSRSERWLDERGKGAWIAAMVIGFILFLAHRPRPSSLHDLEQTYV